MDIATLSMVLSQASIKQDASISLMNKTIVQVEVQGQGVVKMIQESNLKAMEQSVRPHVGSLIDSKL